VEKPTLSIRIIRTTQTQRENGVSSFSLAALRGVSTDSNFPQEVAMITFGQIPTYQSDEKFELAVSDDKRALTVTRRGPGRSMICRKLK
jgi:hypothetical protein